MQAHIRLGQVCPFHLRVGCAMLVRIKLVPAEWSRCNARLVILEPIRLALASPGRYIVRFATRAPIRQVREMSCLLNAFFAILENSKRVQELSYPFNVAFVILGIINRVLELWSLCSVHSVMPEPIKLDPASANHWHALCAIQDRIKPAQESLGQ